MSKMTYNKRKELGLCVNCGKEKPKDNFVCCEKCKEKQKIYQRETREYYRSLGICSRCGKNKLFGNEKECLECSAKMYEVNMRSREKRNFDTSEWYKKDIAILKEKGLCRSCRKKQVKEGHTYCEVCLIKKRERAREYRAKNTNSGISRSERPSYGLCYFCGDKIDREGKVCVSCANRVTNNFSRNGNNEYWRIENKIIFCK